MPLFLWMLFYWRILKQTVIEFFEDEALHLSAALAYYSVFSLAPLLVICVAVAGAALGEDAVRQQLDDQLKNSLGASGAFAVHEMVANARKPEANPLVSLIGVVILLVGAGGLFGQLKDALNKVWGVKPIRRRGIMRSVKDRFLSFSMVLGSGFLLLTSMILSAALLAISRWFGHIVSLPPEVWEGISSAVSFAVVVILFAAIFKILPDAHVSWRHIWVGAIFTSVLFMAGKAAIGWYLGRQSTVSSYGSGGSLALVLLWAYYSSIILLFGAEFTQVWVKSQGEEIKRDGEEVIVPHHHS